MCVYDEKSCYSNDGKEEGESCTKNNDCKFKSCKKIDGSYICCSKSRKIAGDSCVEDSDCNPSLTSDTVEVDFVVVKKNLFTGDVINVDQKMECKKCDDKYCLTAEGKCGLKIVGVVIDIMYHQQQNKIRHTEDQKYQ